MQISFNLTIYEVIHINIYDKIKMIKIKKLKKEIGTIYAREILFYFF